MSVFPLPIKGIFVKTDHVTTFESKGAWRAEHLKLLSLFSTVYLITPELPVAEEGEALINQKAIRFNH